MKEMTIGGSEKREVWTFTNPTDDEREKLRDLTKYVNDKVKIGR